MHSIHSNKWRLQAIFLLSALISFLPGAAWCDSLASGEEGIMTQWSSSSILPLTHVKKGSDTGFTFIFTNVARKKTHEIKLSKRLLDGVSEISAGQFDRDKNQMVLFAFIAKIRELQMLTIQFASPKKSGISAFKIEPPSASAVAIAREAYNHYGATQAGRHWFRAKKGLPWPRKPGSKPRCPQPSACLPAPQPPIKPAPLPPGNKPEPPANPEDCLACKTVRVKCGPPPVPGAITTAGTNHLRSMTVTEGDDLDSVPCKDGMFVLKKRLTGECVLCLGSTFLGSLSPAPTLCDQTMSIEAVVSRAKATIASILTPIVNDLRPLQGKELFKEIQRRLVLIINMCRLQDELVHLQSQKWCTEARSCQEWRSTDTHRKCYEDPQVVALLEQLMQILGNDGRFLTLTPEENASRISLLGKFADSLCASYATLPLSEKIEACMCCASKTDAGLTAEECTRCVNQVCAAALTPGQDQTTLSEPSRPFFCEGLNYALELKKMCDEFSSDDLPSHNCASYVTAKRSTLAAVKTKAVLMTTAQQLEEPDPACHPTSEPTTPGEEAPPPRNTCQCYSASGVEPKEGESVVQNGTCRTTAADGSLIDCPNLSCRTTWNSLRETWEVFEPCKNEDAIH